MTRQWVPGSNHGLVWPDGVAVLPGDLDPGAITTLWERLQDVAELPAFLEALGETLHASVLALPDFAVVLFRDRMAHAAARGRFSVQLDVELISGTGVSTWTERLTVAPREFQLGSGAAAGSSSLPIIGGVVLCSAIISTATSTPRPEGEAPAVAEPVHATPPTSEPTPPVVMPEPVQPAAEPDEFVEQIRAEEQQRVDSRATIHEDLSDVLNDLHEPLAAADTAGERADESDESGQFEHLWGATDIRPVEEGAVRRSDEESAVVRDLFISGVPSDMRSGSDQGSSAAGDLAGDDPWDVGEWDVNDHDHHTVVGSGLAELLRSSVGEADDSREAGTLAVVCAAGHANPPHRAECWRCSQLLAGPPQQVSRPVIAIARTSSGEVIEVNKDVVIGRNPRSRVTGSELPRLLALPYGHISATHLQLRVETWTLLAVDQNSTNGTYLRRHSDPPSRLPDTPIPLSAGDMLDFGHGVHLTVEALA